MPLPAAVREKLLSGVDIILRVPTVFMMDSLINSAFGSSPTSGYYSNSSLSMSENADTPENLEDRQSGFWNLLYVSAVVVRLLGFFAALITFLLPTDKLIETYKWLVSVAVIIGSFSVNTLYLNVHYHSTREALVDVGATLVLQGLFAFIFCHTYIGPRRPWLQRFIIMMFVGPLLLSALPISHPPWANVSTIAALVLVLFVQWSLLCNFGHIYRYAKKVAQRNDFIMRHHGLHVLLEDKWVRLKIPHVLRLFWLVRFSEHIVNHAIATGQQLSDDTKAAMGLTVDEFLDLGKKLLVQGCDTVVAVLGMTSMVASVAHYLSCGIQQFLMAEDDDEKSFGTVSAILFFILALQTGLTGLEPEKRFVRLYRNFCLLFTAILHFIHNMVNPLLMSLSASRNRSINHHGRALLVCAFLVAFPCWFLTYLWRTHNVSTWLLAVSAFCIEVAIKVIISLLIYTLFMIDAYRNTFWEKLDDYVYYVRAIGNTIEFVFGIFLFFNGAWILLFESGGTIRAFMMCIHAYFNIWTQAKAGWKVFVRRRTAVNKINSFPEASVEQLRQLNDVCAICYQEMTTARITWCQHYFHALCLRKWLYIQDRCPMCHKALYVVEMDEVKPAGEGRQQQANGQVPLQRNRDGSQQRDALVHEHQD